MTLERWQLTGTGPESYERYQVPSVFDPLARKFLAHMALRPGERVLDVACGTGIVARHAAAILGPRGSIVGVDLNEKMIEVARAHSPSTGAAIVWRQGDVESLPCPDADFDVVLCQQGMQYFPNKAVAVREMNRVLGRGGRLGLCVWRTIDHSPCHLAIAASLGRHISDPVAQRFQAVFSFGDGDALREVLAAGGFPDAEIASDVLMRRLLPPQESVPGLLASTPVGPDFSALARETQQTIIDEVATALADYRSGDGLEVPQATWLVRAAKQDQ